MYGTGTFRAVSFCTRWEGRVITTYSIVMVVKLLTSANRITLIGEVEGRGMKLMMRLKIVMDVLLHGLLSKSNDQTYMSIIAYCKRTFNRRHQGIRNDSTVIVFKWIIAFGKSYNERSFTISFIIHWPYKASISYFAALNYSHCSAHSSEINKRRHYHNSNWLGICAFLFIVTILDKIAVTALCWHATWAVWRLFIVQYDISTI